MELSTQIGSLTKDEFETHKSLLKTSYKLKMLEKSSSQEEIQNKRSGRIRLLKKDINKAILESPWESGSNRFKIVFDNAYLSSEFRPNLRFLIKEVFNTNYDTENKTIRVGSIFGLCIDSSFKLTYKKLEYNSDYNRVIRIVAECFMIK